VHWKKTSLYHNISPVLRTSWKLQFYLVTYGREELVTEFKISIIIIEKWSVFWTIPPHCLGHVVAYLVETLVPQTRRLEVWFPLRSLNFSKWPNSIGHATGLESTQPPSEISTNNLPGSKDSGHIRLTTSLTSVSKLFRKCGNLNVSQPIGLHGLL
jgi:hypothetical protein